MKKTRPPFGEELVQPWRIIRRGKEHHGGKIVCAPCQIALKRGEPWDLAPAKTRVEGAAGAPTAATPTKIESVQKSLIDHIGDIAEITGWLKAVETRGREKKHYVLRMEDGFEITSWHTSKNSQQLYIQARGKYVRLMATVKLQGANRFYNLDFFKRIGDHAVSEFGTLIQ